MKDSEIITCPKIIKSKIEGSFDFDPELKRFCMRKYYAKHCFCFQEKEVTCAQTTLPSWYKQE